jgi:hypothetical protein
MPLEAGTVRADAANFRAISPSATNRSSSASVQNAGLDLSTPLSNLIGIMGIL